LKTDRVPSTVYKNKTKKGRTGLPIYFVYETLRLEILREYLKTRIINISFERNKINR